MVDSSRLDDLLVIDLTGLILMLIRPKLITQYFGAHLVGKTG